jgi:signal transduction histidine kinase
MTDNSECTREGGGGVVETRESEMRDELDALRRQVEELHASRRRLVLATDTERRAFERALHDGLQQQLVGLAANLQLAARSVASDPSSARKLLDELRGDVREALQQTRTLALRIAPPVLDAGGLVVALRSAAASLDVPSRIDVASRTTIPPELATTVYVCFVELLERVRADASIAITVREKEGTLGFELTTEGEVDAEALSFGDRIEALGGELTIRSGPGNRTEWAGWLPLP